MAITNPWELQESNQRHQPASNIFEITPSDTVELTRVAKALRIYNPNDTVATITVTPRKREDNTSEILTIPPLCVIAEPLEVRKVWETGTSVGLIIHGYTD